MQAANLPPKTSALCANALTHNLRVCLLVCEVFGSACVCVSVCMDRHKSKK
jgi:hypothetical protein